MSLDSETKQVTITKTSAISMGVVLMVLIPALTVGLPKLYNWAKDSGEKAVHAQQMENRVVALEDTSTKLTENIQVLTSIVKRIESNQAKQTQNWTYAHAILAFEMNKNRDPNNPIHPDDVIKYFQNK